ncbi:uncharacterized protein LOC142973723 [Anticarsia gemmatalis]|uniref:uncharacterized protein LOC142973723 n=1 Tax=Anticarsia gemmatalis TaxID=129554 RepID=UPI003F7724DF
MKFLFTLCFVLAVSCSALGAPEDTAILVRNRRDLMENTVKMLEDLIAKLQTAAKEALEAVGNFTSGLVHEAEQIRDRILNDIEKFRNRVQEAIENVFQRFSNSSVAVKECVDTHRTQAANIFNDTVSLTMVCIDERIAEIGDQISELRSLATNAMSEASTAMDSLKKCTQTNNSLLSTGSCLAGIAMQTEMKSLGFFTQSTLLIGRINLSIATLPAALEVCAGSRLVQTGISTGRIVIEIGSCSATAIFNNLTGKN